MTKYENQNVEFKQEYVPEIRKEVVAFANAEGGTIYVGVRKDGVVIGIADPDSVMLQIVNSLKDTIAPDVMPFVKVAAIEEEETTVIEITVSTGTNRPYYIREKGLKPSGVYVRKGSSAQPVSDEGIVEMMIQNRRISYEESRSLYQDLTFHSLKEEMEKRNIEFGLPQMKTLKLLGEDDLYTNLAYILSDQCEITTKIAVFQGADKAIFRDREEFTGSIMKQLEEVYRYIDLANKTKATFSGLERIDTRDYPVEAVREAWLNACVHRDYSFSGSTIINIYDDRMEFVSLGGLVPGMELESIFLGASNPRNRNLAQLFYRLRLVESFGTGVNKIQRMYADIPNQPIFETAKGVFRVTLPNRNGVKVEDSKKERALVSGRQGSFISEKELLKSFTSENGQISRKEAEELLQAGATKAFRLLKELCDEGILKAVGTGKQIRYVLTEMEQDRFRSNRYLTPKAEKGM